MECVQINKYCSNNKNINKNELLHLELEPELVPKTAFCTADGLFKLLKMPFGLKGAPAIFQLKFFIRFDYKAELNLINFIV